MWKGIVGVNFSPEAFAEYCKKLSWTSWRPQFVVLHNTAEPTLVECPNGITRDRINTLEQFYRDTQKWSAGPHLFVDDKQIWVFTPLTVPGVHSPSWNHVALGVEMLGDYQNEDFNSGRGLLVQQNAASAIATLHSVLGLDPHTLRLHKEDPKTTHHCPGDNVDKDKFIQAVIDNLNGGEHPATTA